MPPNYTARKQQLGPKPRAQASPCQVPAAQGSSAACHPRGPRPLEALGGSGRLSPNHYRVEFEGRGQGSRLPLRELQPSHEAAQHIPDARHVAPTCDDRPRLPRESDRWRIPGSWGRGWLACFQDSSTLPTQKGPRKGWHPLPQPRWAMGEGKAGCREEHSIGSPGPRFRSSPMWCDPGHQLPLLGLIFPVWTMELGQQRGSLAILQVRPGSHNWAAVFRVTVQPRGWAGYCTCGQCPPWAGAQLCQGILRW